ncbi:MAG: hypothetical protein ABI321_01170 [Polyangia bacterium]
MPTAAHVVYIPAMLLLGIVIGWILGGRAARDAEASRKARDEAKRARHEARRARGTEEIQG